MNLDFNFRNAGEFETLLGYQPQELLAIKQRLTDEQDHENLYYFDLYSRLIYGDNWEFFAWQQHVSSIAERFVHTKNDIIMAEMDNCESIEDWFTKLQDLDFQNSIPESLGEEYEYFLDEYQLYYEFN